MAASQPQVPSVPLAGSPPPSPHPGQPPLLGWASLLWLISRCQELCPLAVPLAWYFRNVSCPHACNLPWTQCLGQLRGSCRSLASPQTPDPAWTPVPLPSMVCFPARARPGYPGTPPRPSSGLLRRFTHLLRAERWPRELASGPHRSGSRGVVLQSSPSPSFTASSRPLLPAPRGEGRRPCPALCAERTHRGAADAQPRACGAHGTAPGWASSPSPRPGPSLEPSFFFTRISAFFGFPSRLGHQRALRGVP